MLPRVHGSAVFQRGETQALITVTLGTGRDEQRVDGLIDEYSKKFMLDYYFPSFSVGEVRPIRGPGRREIGHGALAERSVKPVLPDPRRFPLHHPRDLRHPGIERLQLDGQRLRRDAGPDGRRRADQQSGGRHLGRPGQGNRPQWTLLTDIIGDEDHFGDMDFKVAGTQNGITGIQLDLKINGISEEIIRATLAQSREARIEILRKMLTAIPRPRRRSRPRRRGCCGRTIDPEKIGLLIGPGGKTIRAIQEATGASIEVEDDGTVTIASPTAWRGRRGPATGRSPHRLGAVGRIYDGRVTSVKDFGAFIEILPGKDGLCHISELSDEYVNSVGDVCKVGDEMQVKVIAHRRPGPRQAQPQGGLEGTGQRRRQGAGRRRRASAARSRRRRRSRDRDAATVAATAAARQRPGAGPDLKNEIPTLAADCGWTRTFRD